jgi:hypothetical protein
VRGKEIYRITTIIDFFSFNTGFVRVLKIFCTWIGKHHIVRRAIIYLDSPFRALIHHSEPDRVGPVKPRSIRTVTARLSKSIIPNTLMNIHYYLILTAAMVFSLSADPAKTRAAGDVRLVLVSDAQGAAMTFQDWGHALDGAGIKNVRLRTATETDKVGIAVEGAAERPLYIVTGKVLSRDELQLPGVRFKRSEMKRLAQWLDDLAQNGPPDKRPKIVAFGLTAVQLEKVKKDLAVSVGFSTAGLARRDVMEKIARKLSFPLRFEDSLLPSPETGEGPGVRAGRGETLKFPPALGEDKVEDELGELSCGTALACLLRPAGYCLVPQLAGNQIKYTVLKVQPNIKEIWPVGRKPEGPPPEVLPGLFEFLPVNVQNIAAAKVLDTIGKRLKTPVLYDRIALAKYKIDPAKAMVSFPRARTNYSMALEKMLFPAGLEFEIRVDEAGRAFLWISTLKPI